MSKSSSMGPKKKVHKSIKMAAKPAADYTLGDILTNAERDRFGGG